MPFFILFIIIPIMELMVFGAVGDEIGLFNALLLALLTAIIGGALVRHQGLQTLREAQDSMARGEMPVGKLFDGLCLVAAGAMLITPGFITDTVGFALLIPAVRHAIQNVLKTHVNWQVSGSASGFGQRETHNKVHRDPDVIDAEYEDLDQDKK